MRPIVDPRFPATLRRLRTERGLSLRQFAQLVHHGKSFLGALETGTAFPTPEIVARLDDALHGGGQLAALVQPGRNTVGSTDDDELAALELARRVEATDVGAETLARIEAAVDELAIAYASTPPDQVLPRARRHLAYVGRLMDARMTIEQRRRLVAAGGWFALIAATLHIDLRQRAAADAHLATARQMAEHAEHRELHAWTIETRAWAALIDKAFPRAVELSRQAQAFAPRGSSVLIQATAQEGRAWARMGDGPNTRSALRRVSRMVSPRPMPEQPEHHYQYDPGKEVSYTTTTLSWVGDPAAERYARGAVAELAAVRDGVRRPRRVALAQLDLSLALLGTNRPDEASAAAAAAIVSGCLVPSTWWRATEVVAGVERAGVREAADLRDAYETYRPGASMD